MGRSRFCRPARLLSHTRAGTDAVRFGRTFRPRLELLEDRVQLGDTVLGLSVVAFGLGSFDAPLPVDPGTANGGRHHGIFFSIHEIDNPPAVSPWEGYRTDAAGSTTSADSGLPASTNEVATPLAMPLSGSDDALARQLVFHRLTGSTLVQSQGFPAGFRISSAVDTAPRAGGVPYAPVAPTEIGDSAGHSARMFAAAGAASRLSFNAFTGQLDIRTGAGEHTVREAATASGFVDVTLDGHDHSSDPNSPSFDRALAGATSSTLAGIRFAGAGQDTLILGSQHLAGGLAVQASGATVLTENVATAAALAIQAPNVTVRGALQGSSIALAASDWINVDAIGRIDSAPVASGGGIDLAAGVFVNSGQLHADGPTGGQINVQAGNILNAGPITANATDPGATGGQVQIAFTGSYVATTAAVISASNEAGPGGQLVIDGGNTGRLYSSGRHLATGSMGGAIALFGRQVVLAGATVDTSGEARGGLVRIGGHPNAQTVTVTPASIMRADAVRTGGGGQVFVGADQSVIFDGTVSARGGSAGGGGGFIEVSGHGDLSYGGSADAGALLGKSGTLLLDPKNIIIGDAPVGVFPQFDLIDPHPTAGGGFGTVVFALDNGNVVVTNPNDDFGGAKAGAIYLFDSLSGALISSLVGGPGDGVGSRPGLVPSVTPLSNGNYVVLSESWNGYRGAATWGSSTKGVSGVLSEANSLVGSHPHDSVYPDVIPLSNGNYVVENYMWNSQRGAVTWGNGSTGVSGTISEANSLVGSNPGDAVGARGVTPLSNGSYVVTSPYWNDDRGAVTWADGSGGVSGAVSEANSLVGSGPDDYVGYGVTLLSNGNYVVRSPYWNGKRGAVTWEDGSRGVSGTVSDANSLLGTQPGDRVGYFITLLSTGNYVVDSLMWNSNRGAVTWVNGSMGVRGTVSEANSLVGSNPDDGVGGRLERARADEYLIGGIALLANGNYVVNSPFWNGKRGAATWGSGITGISGTVSEANSLVGSNPGTPGHPFSGDQAGIFGVTLLRNGNYVVQSPYWNDNRGAVTWGDGSTGVNGTISDANSFVGSKPQDQVGWGGVTALTNGNYVVASPSWNDNRGAATWSDGSKGITGTISDVNSLVGTNPGDYFAGERGGGNYVTALTNGNYVIGSPSWNAARGAVTWGNGSTAVSGPISDANSLIGSKPREGVGYYRSVTPLSNGNYLVGTPTWNGGRGAVTWGNGGTGISGTISEANSLIGSKPGDGVGYDGYPSLIMLSNGNYVVVDPFWNGTRGSVTWGNSSTGVSGTISEANSLIGTNPQDGLGLRIQALSNGGYLIQNANWNNMRGALTLCSGTRGRTLDGRGLVTPQNSLVGQVANAGFGFAGWDPIHHLLLAPFVTEGGGRVTVGLADPNQFSYARGQGQTATLTPDFLTGTLNTGTAVVLQASNDITVNSPITVSAGGHGGALTLEAGRSIVLNASITTDNGALTLIANDQLASGVVDSQRDPGNAVITMAPGTALDTGSGPLTVELRDGAGLTNPSSGAITLQTVTAGSVSVINNGPSAGSDVNLGPVTTSGPQTYSDPNGTTNVTGNLTAADNPITLNDSVVANDAVRVNAGGSTVNFAGSGTQTLQSGNGTSFVNLNHTGTGTLRLASGLTVTGTLTNSAGIFDANDQAVTVTGPATVAGGTYLAGTAPQTFSGGLSITGGAFSSSTGPMTVNGPIAVLGGQLNAAGTVGPVTAIGGIVTPGGTSPGVLSVAGAVTFFGSTTFSVLCNGPMPGSDYSQLQASGPITLANSFLTLVLGFQPPVGSSFEIVTNTSSAPINGRFTGLDEGAIFTQGDYHFQITYQGGTGGASVVLTRLV